MTRDKGREELKKGKDRWSLSVVLMVAEIP